MIREIELTSTDTYSCDLYPCSGIYKVTITDESRTEILLVLKEYNNIYYICNWTKDNERKVKNIFTKIINGEESTEIKTEVQNLQCNCGASQSLLTDAILKTIAVTQKPDLIKDLV